MAFSPMITQYLRLKEQYPDCFVLFRLGDFYELFFSDAEEASKILDLVLTKRACGDKNFAPMCGVPYHALDAYVSKLLASGKKVAICEQLTDAADSKNLVERDIVRVVTAGTIIETDILDEKRNNYLCAMAVDEFGSAGIALCDISTGSFFAFQSHFTEARKLENLLLSYAPAEIIGTTAALRLNDSLAAFKSGRLPQIKLQARFDDAAFGHVRAVENIKAQFGISAMTVFGLGNSPLAVGAAGGLLEYLKTTQKRALVHLSGIKLISNGDFMSIDYNTSKNLELCVAGREGKRRGSLVWLLDKTRTGMGARTLTDWVERPLQKRETISARLDGVNELFQNFLLREKLVELLQSVKDIERLAAKLSCNNILPREYLALGASLEIVPQIKELLSGCGADIFVRLAKLIKPPLAKAAGLINSAIVSEPPAALKDGGYIKGSYDTELGRLVDIAENGGKYIKEMEERERARTGIKTLKIDRKGVFGYCIEVTNSFKNAVPADYVRRQTLAGGERYTSEELKQLEDVLLSAEEARLAREKLLYAQLREMLLEFIPDMQSAAWAVGIIDVLTAFAQVSAENGYVLPQMKEAGEPLIISGGRHPIVEKFVKRENFIANDTLLDCGENRTMVLTGPNMAGKSTYLRQVALIVLMAHIGCFVPAKSAQIPLTDRIFTRVGASDDLSFNQSTFMVEMVEVAYIVHNATAASLIILDEVGRGTATYDGLSIAWAVLEHISGAIKAKTLFATHFHELTELEGRVEGVKNYKVTVTEIENSIVFLRKIARGGANKSFGIEVARLAGVPISVTERAHEIAALLEQYDINYVLSSKRGQSEYQNLLDRVKKYEPIINSLRDIETDDCTPKQALDILANIVNKAKKGK